MEIVNKQCPECKKSILLPRHRMRYYSTNYCRSCWHLVQRRGGRHKDSVGYIRVRVYRENPLFKMARHDGYILEHRLVMAQNLGRLLERWEIVHHKNHIKDDNRIENLELVASSTHKQITLLENRVRSLENRVLELEAENILLRSDEYSRRNSW